MKANDIVKFSKIVEPGDEKIQMRVIEVNGDRVLVEDLIGWTYNPTHVYMIEDLEEMG